MSGLSRKEKIFGSLFFGFFFTLIIAGIIAKRIYGHPDWMVFFHLPAAVLLVLSARILSRPFRERYQEEMARYRTRNVDAES